MPNTQENTPANTPAPAFHKLCSPSDHLNCRRCGTLICVDGDSPTRAAMYRATPVCPDCKDRRDR